MVSSVCYFVPSATHFFPPEKKKNFIVYVVQQKYLTRQQAWSIVALQNEKKKEFIGKNLG